MKFEVFEYEVLIDGKQFLVLGDTETYKAFHDTELVPYNLYKTVEACYIFRDDVYIMLTKAKEMLVSVEGLFYRYYTRLDFNSKGFGNAYISVCYFTMNLLIIGTSNGLLKAYYVAKSSDLLQLDFDKPTWTEKGGSKSGVKHIDVGLINSANVLAIVITQEDNLITVIQRYYHFQH